MTSNLSYIIEDYRIVLYVDGKQHVINEDDVIIDDLKQLLLSDCDNKYEPVKLLLNELYSFLENIGDDVIIKNDSIYIDGLCVEKSIGRLIENLYNDDKDIDPLINFIRNVRENPNKNIINEICAFIEKSYDDGGFTITDNGYIIAYKHVRMDYKDIHSGLFDNGVGTTVEMNRNDVCSDRNVTCAAGLHFCSFSYLNNYKSYNGGRTMILEIDPKHIVSIPEDYRNAKGRCCKYKVVGEMGIDHSHSVIKKPVFNITVEDDSLSNIYNSLKTLEKDNKRFDNNDLIESNILVLLQSFCSLYTIKEIEELYKNSIDKVFPLNISKKAKSKFLFDVLKRRSYILNVNIISMFLKLVEHAKKA